LQKQRGGQIEGSKKREKGGGREPTVSQKFIGGEGTQLLNGSVEGFNAPIIIFGKHT